MPRRGSDDDTSAARALGELDVNAYLSDSTRKQEFVTAMFDVIAPRYDDFTRVFSFGMDSRWKAEVLGLMSAVDTGNPALMLDLACGTGDFAHAAAARGGYSGIVGIDASLRMVAHATARSSNAAQVPTSFIQADMMHLPVGDASVQLVTAGYAFRNVPDYRVAIAEVARVLKPGALLITLDFYNPPGAYWRKLFLRYLHVAGKVVGWSWHRSPIVYEYIAHSIRHFVSAREFTAALNAAGFDVEFVSVKLYGGVAVHYARRRGKPTR